MMTMYVKTGCPFCAKARATIEELNLTDKVEEKNIADQAVADELVEKGGKRQVPYLVDPENNIALYESDDISTYLRNQYGS